MDVLDKYKKAWKNQPEDESKVSKVDIYKMTKAKSSSIVKWIFIIGILELLFWGVLNILLMDSSYNDIYKELHIQNIVTFSTCFHYFIILLFLVSFYLNYKSISSSSTTKDLIRQILNTRRVVKYYVYFNLIYSVLVNIIVLLIIFNDLDLLMEFYNNHSIDVSSDKEELLISLIVVMTLVLTGLFFTLWLFYRFIYGGLLKKLNYNHKELAKLDQLN